MPSVEETIEKFQALILEKTGKSLSFIQKVILRESLNQTQTTYTQIALENNYSENYIRQLVAPKLWQLLSETLGEKVNRTNCRAVLEQRFEILSSVNNSQTTQIQSLEHAQSRAEYPLESPEGTVPLASPFYIERGIEQICYQEIIQPGAFVRIKASRQMGKTSLMTRIISHASFHNYNIVRLSLYRAETNIFSSTQNFLQWLCANVNRQLGIKLKISSFWDEDIGALMNATVYFQEHLLNQISTPILLALDEVNQLFEYPNLARDFLALLRSWYEESRDISIWRNLRVLIVYSTNAYINLHTNKTLFNVGTSFELPPFTRLQVEDLTQRHQIQLTEFEFEQVMELTGGFPYLVRLLLYHSSQHQLSIENLRRDAASDIGIFYKHLHELLWHLKQNPNLAAAFSEVVLAQAPIFLEQEVAFKLKSLGLISLQESHATVSCLLYKQYFTSHMAYMLNT
ncbi:serine/threonine protein kinase [Calothrix sp. HK-06]|nr:serine/threonine protein kinase [Calothrix sp. HK-06]